MDFDITNFSNHPLEKEGIPDVTLLVNTCEGGIETEAKGDEDKLAAVVTMAMLNNRKVKAVLFKAVASYLLFKQEDRELATALIKKLYTSC